MDKCISSFSNLCPVLHSSALEIDIFLRKSFMASFRLKKKLVGMNWHINLIGISCSDWALYSLPRCFFVYNFHTSSRAKNRRSKRQGKTSLSQNFFWKKWNFLNCVDLFFTSRKIGVYLYFFLHEILLIIFLAGNFKGSLVKIFAENDDRGYSVQIGPNFPAKSLSIYVRKIFLDTFSSFNWKLTCN